jgi:hypothetical protein
MAEIGIRPRAGKIADAVQYSGFSRSTLYVLAAQHLGLFRKHGRAVIVDFDILDLIIANLPAAEITARKAG